MNGIIEKLKTRGYWSVRLHPRDYEPEKVSRLGELERAVAESAVSLRGWDFPHLDSRSNSVRASNYIEQSIDWEHHVEFWRAFKSGQLVAMCGLWGDWRDQSTLWPSTERWDAPKLLGAEDAIYRLVEVFECACRWKRAIGINGALVIRCDVHGLDGRIIQLASERGGTYQEMRCANHQWTDTTVMSTAADVANPRELAVSSAIRLFEQFGWDVKPEIIREIQSQLRG